MPMVPGFVRWAGEKAYNRLVAGEGYVNVGISSDTAVFAANSIRSWWHYMGASRFPNVGRLYITADGGGSNGSRCRLWKVQL